MSTASKNLKRLALGLALVLAPAAAFSQSLPAVLTVNAAATLTSFSPISIFGNNTAYWVGNSDNVAVQSKVQAAGNFLLRYPGGSSSDDFHWNGSGVFGANNYWVPSGTTYTPGFSDRETYRGTTSSYGSPSQVTDGSNSTVWLSNVDTDLPNHQWAELDLASSAPVNAVTLVWGTPYASSFQVQYWPSAGWPPPLSDNSSDQWVTIGTYAGTGGTQGVTFAGKTAQYFRVLMTASSAGAGGAYSIAEAELFNGGTQVSVNSSSSANQTQVEVSSTDPASTLNYTVNPPGSTDFESFMAYANSFAPHAIPLITVNLGTGTAQEAASWVYYANVKKGYGIKYWQIGNETEGSWETGGPLNARDYVRRYIEYFNAMKAVDPTIVITGPVSGSFADSSNLYDGKSYTRDFIELAGAAGVSQFGSADHFINAVDFHWYPNYGAYTPAAALTSTSTLDAFPAQLQSWLTGAGLSSPSTVPVFMSEFNVDPGDENFQVQLANGLWVADALGHFIKDFGSRGFSNLWDTLNGGSGSTSPTGGDLGYLNVTSGAYQYQPRASYWAMQLAATDWAIQGDGNAHQLVSATSSQTLLAAYADKRPDNVLSLMVVNKDPVNAYNTTLNLSFTPNTTANGWTFDASNYAWVTTGATPYHAAPDTAPATFALGNASGSFPVTFKPYSITVLQFTNSGQATNTPTNTATITATPTLTATPNYGPSTLVDDFEDLSRDGVPPARTNLWNGGWNTSQSAGTITAQYGVPGAGGTTYAVKLTGSIGAGGWSNYQSNLSQWPPVAYDLSGSGVIGLQFWMYGDGQTYRVMVDSQAVTDYDYYGVQLTPPAGQWTFFQVPFSSMTRQGWGTQTGLPATFPGHDANGLQFATQSTGPFSYQLDQIGFYTLAGEATSTATKTATFTPTATVSRTATDSVTPSATASPSQTASSTGTGTASITASRTATDSPTPSPTATATDSLTATATSTPSMTATFSITPTYSPSATPSMTPSRTGTASPSATGTDTPSATPTPTGTWYTSTPTDTPTDSMTPTRTSSPTVTVTDTATRTPTGTMTSSATSTPTFTPTNTGTGTASHTATETTTTTPTATPTLTGTSSPSATPTPTASLTSTRTPTRTATPTFTRTFTRTPTDTSTWTPTTTPSTTWTWTPTQTLTLTPSATPTPVGVNVLYPNPLGAGRLLHVYYGVDGTVDSVAVKVFTLGFRKIYEAGLCPSAPGRHDLVIDPARAGLDLANGLYYVAVEFRTGGRTSRKVLKLLVQR